VSRLDVRIFPEKLPAMPIDSAIAADTGPAPEPRLEISGSRQLTGWMAEQNLSIGFTTYQAGKVFLVGLSSQDRLSIFERTFSRCMGLCSDNDGQTLWMSSLYQLWRFENALSPGQTADGYDRMYVPQVGYTTGDIDVHDVAVQSDGRVVFVNTLFGCVSTISDTHSFQPLWKPPFLSRLAAEDRCHLNGMAMQNGRPAWVTAVSQSDVNDGWRDHRRDGGCVINVDSNEIVVEGLSMPHSPRWYRDRLWLLDSGHGQFGYVDTRTGTFHPVAFCPGYLRGLAFAGDYAIVGLSRPRHDGTFSGLALGEELETRGARARCGLQVIDLNTGDVVHWLRIEGIVEELYDVIVLPGVTRPMLIGFKTDEIRRTLSIESHSSL